MNRYEQLLTKAIEAGQAREYDRSIAILSEILMETDAFPEALLYMARSLHALEEDTKALNYIVHFLDRRPDSPAGLFFAGRILLALGRYTAATVYLHRALESSTDAAEVRAYLGLAYLKQKKADVALEYLATAVEQMPENRSIYTGYMNALLTRAVQCFYADDYDLAAQMFEFILKQGFESRVPHLYLALIYKAGQAEKALHHMDRVLRTAPEDDALKMQKAEILLRLGRGGDAAAVISSVRDFDAESLAGTLRSENMNELLAVEYYRQGDYRKALHFAVQTLGKREDGDIFLLAGECQRELGKSEAAEKYYIRALEQLKTRPEPYYGLILINWQAERYEKMEKVLKHLLRQFPDDETGQYYTLLCRWKRGYPAQELLTRIQEAVRAHPADPFLFTILGDLYIRSDLPELAEKWLEKALILSPGLEIALEARIRLYRVLQQREDLGKAYDAILTHYPERENDHIAFIQLLLEQESFDRAIRELLSLLPNSLDKTRLNRLLAYCYRRKGEFRDAAILYKLLLRESPRAEHYLKSLIYCLDKLDRERHAFELLGKALKFLKKPSVDLMLIYGVKCFNTGDTESAMQIFRRITDRPDQDWRVYHNMGLIFRKQNMEDMARKYLDKAKTLRKNA